MSMGLSDISAEDILNNYKPEDLKNILKYLGEEKEASKIVKNIIKERKLKKIKLVSQLVDIIKRSKKRNFKKKIDISTKTFQALRIFVNKEITELIEGIIKATKYISLVGISLLSAFILLKIKLLNFILGIIH